MNARQTIFNALGEHRYSTKTTQPLNDWRSLDSLLADFVKAGHDAVLDDFAELVRRAALLGYGPEDK